MAVERLSEEIAEKARKYVLAQLLRGKPASEIRAELYAKKYPQYFIDDVLKDERRLLVKEREKKPFPVFWLWIILIAVIIAVFIVFFLPMMSKISLSFPSFGKTCANQTCFLEAANLCNSANFQQTEADSVFKYNIRGCVLTKTALKINETEPVEIRNLLQGKSMACAYEKGSFDAAWVSTLSLNLENCTGDLKDSIEQLLLVI
jgi:hypothetical protein